MSWRWVYKRAIQDDGSLLFPERLSKDFLDNARRTMGSYLFANQYQNEIIPDEEKNFKAQWLRVYRTIPEVTNRFAFIDPAIGQEKHHDYTAICVVDVDLDGHWYLRLANRYRLTPSQIVNKMFELHAQFNLKGMGVEQVAYQEALLYMVAEEMKKRQKTIPVTGITRSKTSKNTRILALVPRFEWGRISISQGMVDFEDEYNSFPRGRHDDIMDSLASIEEIAYYPERPKEKILQKPHDPHSPQYEKWIIQNMVKRQNENDN
jgi:predicted phage terminase large subunit-like protein